MERIDVSIDFSPMYAVPDVGGIKPVSIEIVVVLPAPFAPKSEVICPGRICRSRLDTATPPLGPLAKALRNLSMRTPRLLGKGSGSASSASGSTFWSSLPAAPSMFSGADVGAAAAAAAASSAAAVVPHQYDGVNRKYHGRCRPYSDGIT